MEKRIFDVFPDADVYRQAQYPESANHPDWAPIDTMLGKIESLASNWRIFDLPSYGSSEINGDFFYFSLGTLAIRGAAESRVQFRERFKGKAEFLPFMVDGELCYVIHFTGKHDALDYTLTDHRRISNGAIIASSGGLEVFRSDFCTADWLFRIIGTICIYTINSGSDGFYEIYHNEGMTGLQFQERRFASDRDNGVRH